MSAAALNFHDLASRIRRKLTDEPDNLKDLRRFARDGQFESAGDTATATLKDVKDRALYFKNDQRPLVHGESKGRRARVIEGVAAGWSPTPIDLRSDTVTRPTPGMRAAMAAAEVGDDVFDEDPTVHRLQDRVAELLGTEAALFVPTGTMANQICVRVHTQPGDELICETTSHVYVWEAGAPAVLSGVTTRIVDGDFGVLDVEQLHGLIRPGSEHYVRTRMVVAGEHAQPRRRPRVSARENSANRGLGACATD